MIKVSVIIPAYNHERYIAKAIESVISQKADFDWEVLIGEDSSSDNTGKIVRKYADAHPERIKGIIRKKNLGAARNIKDLYLRAQGEYIAMLEGDDYWLDELKLQKQVELLDSHPDFVASFGRSILIDENDNRNKEDEQYFPWITEGIYTIEDFNKFLIPGQTATAMYRRTAMEELLSDMKKDWRKIPRFPLIDRFLILGMLAKGKIHTAPDHYAAYRYVLNNSGSWSSKHEENSLKTILFWLYGMKEMERVSAAFGISLCLDDQRKIMFSKIAEYKGQISIISINMVRFLIWLWYKDKKEFIEYLKERHAK